ncbi:MAG: ABC transporter substrate-binding protein [Sphaerochaetaceae bacterium]|jgi:NitT/TauT family transport system substrate-binding protein
MKRFSIVLMIVVFVLITPLVAKGAKEVVPANVVRMAVMQGPSGFGVAGLAKDDGNIDNGITLDIEVFPSPNEVIARLANGELDIAALPTNVAANLFNKGVGVKLAAVTGEGMLMLLTTDHSITELEHLYNRNIAIPGAGGTPDQLTQILIAALGYQVDEDIFLDYGVAAPAQLAQMLIANRVDLAVLPEPFVTMVLNSNEKAVPLMDVQQLWSALTGTTNYPMTVIVVSDKFAQEHSADLPVVMNAIKESITWVTTHPQDAGVVIEQLGIMNAAMATPAIPRCNLVFRTAKEAFDAVDVYYKVLYGFDYTSIGSEVPDASFYLSY